MRKNLYLPIEITARELEAKVLLAIMAAQQEYRVFMGSRSRMFQLASQLGTGVMLAKDAVRASKSRLRTLKEKGILICVHDEEGAILVTDRAYMNARLETGVLKYVDVFFTWGGHQASLVEMVKEKYPTQALVAITGHPRTDILRKPFANMLYGKSLGKKLILVNTKLSEANHRSGDNGWMDLLEAGGVINSPEERQRRQNQKKYKEELMSHYFKLIDAMHAELPDYDIVIRPHPSENKNTWLDFAASYERVCVRWDKSIGYWINQASIIVHTGCTTAVEALIMGKPSISFKPLDICEFDSHVPDSISTIVSDIPSLIRAVQQDNHNLYDRFDLLKPYFSNIEGRYAYQAILDVLLKQKINQGIRSEVRYLQMLVLYKLEFIKGFWKSRVRKNDEKFSATSSDVQSVFEKLNVTAPCQRRVKLSNPATDVYVFEV